MILVDSSVWIDAWRGRNPKIAVDLTRHIESGEAAINFLIRTELLQGARDQAHQRTLRELLHPVAVLPFPDDLWEESPLFYLQARQKGKTMTTIDCLIATHARVANLPLWSLDGVFHDLRGLILYS